MQSYKWLFIIASMLAGVFTPWQIQAVVMLALLMAYIACFQLKWPNLQIVLESLFGGLATGLGLQFLVAFGSKNHVAAMIIVPLLLWLILRILFMGLETKYTLSPNAAVAQMRAEDAESVDHRDDVGRTGTSAWDGGNSGQALIPDASGRYLRYEFFATGEIAMGGPTYGEAVFNNGCAFSGVGPSIVVSDDGHYAAMTLPSRNEWGLLIANLRDKKAYEITDGRFWEIDRIEDDIIYGRHSPITSNSAQQLSILAAIKTAQALPMLQDDGWWVIDYEGREPFKQYKVVTISSKQGAHKVTFVPDLKPFKSNPFLRTKHPLYTVLVDDELIELDTGFPAATWVDGQPADALYVDRFLVLSGQIFDFKDAENGRFSIKNHTVLPSIKGCDEHSNTSFGEISDAGHGNLLARGYVLPRSIGWDAAEYAFYSHTSPWDDEKVTYWNIKGHKCEQSRSRIQRFVDYIINLDKLSQIKDLKNCILINLVNRTNPKYQARLVYQNESNIEGGYSAYQLTTSCGVTLENVLQEAIWSHCGRYLAVVHFEHPPLVPHKISIIDFETSTIKKIAGSYALPSFIWFDTDMLDFTHVVGIDEHLNFGPNRNDDENQQLRLSDPVYAANSYDLLIKGFEQRKKAAEKRVDAKKSKLGYSDASVSLISQHCILFAHNFDTPVLQPPINVKPEQPS